MAAMIEEQRRPSVGPRLAWAHQRGLSSSGVKCRVRCWSGGSNLVATCDVVMRCDAMRDGV